MKIKTIILSICLLLIASAHVSYASDVGKHLGTKTEMISSGVYHVVPAVVEFNSWDFSFDLSAILVEPIAEVKIGYSYLEPDKLIYKSPSVDRKWVWFYSINYNV